MTIAYIRTYSNKQQTESQKNAIEQFAKAKKIEIDKNRISPFPEKPDRKRIERRKCNICRISRLL